MYWKKGRRNTEGSGGSRGALHANTMPVRSMATAAGAPLKSGMDGEEEEHNEAATVGVAGFRMPPASA